MEDRGKLRSLSVFPYGRKMEEQRQKRISRYNFSAIINKLRDRSIRTSELLTRSSKVDG